MHFRPPSRQRTFPGQSGNSLVPVLIIVAALAVSGVIFFTFTRKKMEASRTASAPTAPAASQTAPSPAPSQITMPDGAKTSPAGGTPKTADANTPAAPTKPAPAASLGFARPLDLGTQLARQLASGDIKAAAQIASAGNPALATEAATVLEKIFKEMGYKPTGDDKVELLGQIENYTRLSIPIAKAGAPDAALRLQIDLERDEKMGWKIAKMHLPKELSSALASLPEMSSPAVASTAAAKPATTTIGPDGKPVTSPVPPPPGALKGAAKSPMSQTNKSLFAIAETQDALSFATEFVKTLLSHDFVSARKFIDEAKVPAQKLAGLCIVFEEGQYELKPAKPLIMTIANPEVSWVIAQVQSETLQQSTEFGLELQRASTAEEWHVAGLNLSEILGSFAQSASKLGVPYTPLVKNPKGGESLALYFEYDRAELHPRAMKQLEIVAGLLKSDPNRKLNIAGHTDAKGADDYNLRLSRSRAESVKKQLIALGVPPSQVVTTAMGKAQPLGPNQKADGSDDPEGRSKNRRAEIYLDF